MTKKFLTLPLLWLGIQPLTAQMPQSYRDEREIGLAFEELELHANAQDRLQTETKRKEGLEKEWLDFRSCLSGLELMNADAERMALDFEDTYPESPYTAGLYRRTANHFFRLRSYTKALGWFERIAMSRLPESEQTEMRFKRAYAQFMLRMDSMALLGFDRLSSKSSEYQSAATYYRSFILYTDSQYESALQGFEQLRSDEQFGAVAPYYLAQIYYKTGRYEPLIHLAEEILKKEEVIRRGEIIRLLADAYYRSEDFGNAAIYLERYKAAGGRFKENDRFQLGYCYFRTGRYSEAIHAFNKITDASGALSQEAWYHLGDCYLKTGEKTKALTAFEAASRSGSDAEIEREARYLFVKINYEVESPFEEVGRALRNYLDTYSPDEEKKREINALLANHYIDEKNYPKALEALREADPRNAELRAAHQKVAYYRGIQLINAGAMQEAQELFKESQSFAVSDQLLALAHYWTAEALYRQKEYNKAIDSYRRFRESPGAAGTSEFILAVYDQAYAHYRLKEWETAAALFRSFNESYDLEDGVHSDARIRAADCYFMQSRYRVASAHYQEASEKNSREADYALFQLANCLGLLGDDQEKIDVLMKLKNTHPDSRYLAEAAYERANTLLKLDRSEEALLDFSNFRQAHPEHPLVRMALLNEGLAFRNTGALENAVQRLREVVERYPATQEATEAISFARLVYSDLGQIDRYIDWVESIDFANVQEAKLDSTLYSSAFEAYALEDLTAANSRFAQYLERFPTGLFIRKVRYYHAVSLEKAGQEDEALIQWEELFQLGAGDHRDIAVFQLGKRAFQDSAYDRSRDFFIQLGPDDDPQKLRESRFYLLRIADLQQDSEAVIGLANTILADEKTPPDQITYALLLRARARFDLDRLPEAASDFQQLYDHPKGVSAAEAGYHLARILYMDSEHRRSVEKVYESMERTPGFPKWRVECLLLLVENFIALDDPFQAEYTLDFIEENTIGEGKVERITELRDRLKEKQEEEANEQSASEGEEEAFKSLYLNNLPSIELPEEEGEELSIGPGETGEEEEEEDGEASLEEELTKEANNDEDDDEQN